MTNLKKNTARAALIALMASAPMAAFAEIEIGSPAQGVAENPNEYAAPESMKPIMGSMYDAVEADQGEGAYEDAEIVDDANRSIHKGDAKRDG